MEGINNLHDDKFDQILVYLLSLALEKCISKSGMANVAQKHQPVPLIQVHPANFSLLKPCKCLPFTSFWTCCQFLILVPWFRPCWFLLIDFDHLIYVLPSWSILWSRSILKFSNVSILSFKNNYSCNKMEHGNCLDIFEFSVRYGGSGRGWPWRHPLNDVIPVQISIKKLFENIICISTWNVLSLFWLLTSWRTRFQTETIIDEEKKFFKDKKIAYYCLDCAFQLLSPLSLQWPSPLSQFIRLITLSTTSEDWLEKTFINVNSLDSCVIFVIFPPADSFQPVDFGLILVFFL